MENTSLRGRFSLSTTNLTSPIAESTRLNGSSSHTKFNWGEGTIGSRSRNNSQQNASIAKNLNGTPSKVTMSPTSRIDPRTFVDIHSNGLASRIVKYHDNTARLNRSLSMGNLYNKPGQFPVVHLKKNEMQYKARKSRNLSMTKIAAPEKSVFHGNTLSSILRSGSIVGLQKSDEEISRENRPILHPPPTENELAPTRSVLEVLKEISRKRINSDELDGSELIKKHCKQTEFDGLPYNGQKTQSKRQREMSTSASNSVKVSPEQQVVKKRMCNYNNDILSSLSSSMLSANKNKMLEIQSQKPTASDLGMGNNSSANLTRSGSLRNEKQRCMSSFDLEHLAQPSKFTPISPLPNSPQQIGVELDKNRNSEVMRRASEPVISNTKPKLTLFNKDYDEMPTNVRNDVNESKEDDDLCGIQFVKPKKSSSLSSGGTLIMERVKKSKLALMLSGLKGELIEEDEVDSLPKVEEQKTIDVTVNVVSTTEPSVLSTPAAISFSTTTTAANTLISTSDATNKTAPTPAGIKNMLQFNPSVPTSSTSSSATNGFRISTTTVAASTSSTPVVDSLPATTTAAPITSVTSSTTSIPTLGGFSFGHNKPLALPTTTTTTVTSQPVVPQVTTAKPASSATVPTTTTEIKPFSFGLTAVQTSTATPSFTFGAPSTSSPSVPAIQTPLMTNAFGNGQTTVTKTSESPPVFGQTSAVALPTYSFSSLAASNSNSNTTSSSTITKPSIPSAISAPTFNFGVTKSSWSPSSNSAPTNANSIIGLGSFGSAATSTSVPQSTAALTSTTSSGGFSFSNSSTTEASKPIFGSIIPAATTSSISNTTFSFPANKTSTAQTNSSNAFTFSSPAASSGTTANPAQPSMFGITTPVKPSNSFSFGTQVPAMSSAPLKSSFSFSSADKPAVATTTAGNSIGGFTFNPPAPNSHPASDSNKNIFGNATTAAPSAKPIFNFGSAPSNQTANNPPMFGNSSLKPTNLFGAPVTTTTQSSPFTFGSSTATNQGVPATAPSTNLFGSGPSSNQTSGTLGGSSSGTMFGAPSAAVAPIQQSASFTFGSSNNAAADTNKHAGGFVFGSSSSIGNNATKPSADLNKTFVFGDGSTTITPAPPTTTNLFGGSSGLNSNTAGVTENKIFSFGGGGAAPAGNNNTFGGASRQTVNQSPVFNFGAGAPPTQAPAQNGNLFNAQPAGAPTAMMGPSDRPKRKAMRRLHKT